VLDKVVSLLKQHGFLHMDDVIDQKLNLLQGFKNVYFDSAKSEVYIVVDKNEVFLADEIEEYETQISGFITLFANDVLTYNVNLVLISPIGFYEPHSTEKQLEYMALINRFERDKYFCRKIFLDKKSRGEKEIDELSILPFNKITIEENTDYQDDDESKLAEIFKQNNALLIELTKPVSEINIELVQNLLINSEDKGEKNE